MKELLLKLSQTLKMQGSEELTEEVVFAELNKQLGTVASLTNDLSTARTEKEGIQTKLTASEAKVTTLETKVTELSNEITTIKNAEITQAKTEVTRLYGILMGDKKNDAVIASFEKADLAALKAFEKDYATQLEAKFPGTCKDCGSHNVARSTADVSNAGGESGKKNNGPKTDRDVARNIMAESQGRFRASELEKETEK
jgi:hypothetical protein